MNRFGQLLKETYSEWSSNKAPRLAAALSYYTLFAMAPLLVIVVQIAAIILGAGRAAGHHRALREILMHHLGAQLGPAGSEAVGQLIDTTVASQGQGLLPAVLGWGVLLLAAIGLFGALKDALNTIWELPPPPPRSWWHLIHDRAVSFCMIAGLAGLLLLALASSLVLAALPLNGQALQILNTGVAFALATCLFAFIFKYLPDLRIRWADVWVGALLTTFLSAAGQLLLGVYLSHLAATSTFGAAGSMVVLLVWVYYQAQILLFGAEFTRIYASSC
ncbi:YihY/virulence factor BrkB family protein [bacterium]|nr:YihY/virulence factor BrkB family protein [bacterium]